MIGKLKGVVDSLGEDWVIVDVGGVGYHVECSARTLRNLPSVGEAVSLSIETHVREDHIRLFGFAAAAEREWFRLLLTVQGVGARVALAVLSTLSATDLSNAIALQDKAAVSQTPGVGPKVAQRIVSELKEKAPALAPSDVAGTDPHAESGADGSTAIVDAISALTNLGYTRARAAETVSRAVGRADEDAPPETLIRLALKELAR